MSTLDRLGVPATAQRTQGRTPVYRLLLSGEPLDVTVQSFTMTLSEDRHDTGEMTVSSQDRTTTEGLLDAPISFLFGIAPKSDVFSGYVTSISEVQNDTGVLTWTMSFVGPTKVMQTGTPRFWANRTIPQAVETLSYLSYLGYTGHDHAHVWTALAQASSSDWQMATSLAARLGWSVYNRHGVVGLYDPLKLFQEQGFAANLISETYTIAKTAAVEERVLLDFEPTEVAESDHKQQGQKVAYFNEGELQVALQKGDHTAYRFISDFVIRNAAEAAIYVNNDDSDASNWRQSAKARIVGNATLYPGMSVEIMTTSRSWAPGKFNGRWLIRAVQHKMDRQSFQSNLALARPDGKTQVYTGGYAPFWQQQQRARPTLTLSSTTTLPGAQEGILPIGVNVWVSSWSNPTVRMVA